MTQKRACFFAAMRDPAYFTLSEFLANDIRILKELGFVVRLAHQPWSIPLDCDLYFAWHWLYSWPVLLVSKILAKPFISAGTIAGTPDGLTIEHYRRNRPLVERISHKLIFAWADAVIATSSLERDFVRLLGARRLHLVHSCVDTHEYTPASIPFHRRIRRIVTVAILKWHNVERKRIASIIRSVPLVLEHLPEMQFVIVGPGDPDKVAALRTLARSLGVEDHVRFAGGISRDAKIRLLQESLLYLQPTSYEGFGVSIAEAMSCGLPVVVAPGGAVPEVVGPCGQYLRDARPESISKAIVLLLADPERWCTLSRCGRDRICGMFGYERRRDAMGEIIESVSS